MLWLAVHTPVYGLDSDSADRRATNSSFGTAYVRTGASILVNKRCLVSSDTVTLVDQYDDPFRPRGCRWSFPTPASYDIR